MMVWESELYVEGGKDVIVLLFYVMNYPENLQCLFGFTDLSLGFGKAKIPVLRSVRLNRVLRYCSIEEQRCQGPL